MSQYAFQTGRNMTISTTQVIYQKSYPKHTVKLNLFVGFSFIPMIKNTTLALTFVFSLSLTAGIDAPNRLTLGT